MKSNGMRLGVARSLSPYSTLNPIQQTEPKSASLAQAERDIKALKEENAKLREEIFEIRSLYKQLISETGQEQFDERRVHLLKSQVIQLERQVLLLSDGLSSRTATVLEVENALAAIADQCRGHLGPEKLGAISVPRADLELIVQTAESARIKLYKNVETVTVEKMSRPLLMMGKFALERQFEPVTLMDVCSGRLEHINLKHVGKLENRLVQLYKQLMLVNQSLYAIVSTSQDSSKVASKQVPQAVYVRLGGQVSKSCQLLQEVSQELLELSILVPGAPWPPLQKPFLGELTVDHVISGLPNFHKSRQQEGRQMLEALLKAMNYKLHMATVEHKGLEAEVKFHQSVYQLQLEYVDSLFKALRESYGTFEENTNELLCNPLKEVFKKYETLRDTASEEALRDFLAVFKLHSTQIEDTVDQLSSRHQFSGGQEALSEFGAQFFMSVEKVQLDHQHNRDQQVAQVESVKEEHQQHLEDLLHMFPPPAEPDDEDLVDATASLSIREDDGEVKDQKKKAVNATPTARERRRSLKKSGANPECSCGAESPKSAGSPTESSSASESGSNKKGHFGGQTPKTPGAVKRLGLKPPMGKTPQTPATQSRSTGTPFKKPVPGVGMGKLTLKPRSKKTEGETSPQDEGRDIPKSGMLRCGSLNALDQAETASSGEEKSQIQSSGSISRRSISKIPSPSPLKK